MRVFLGGEGKKQESFKMEPDYYGRTDILTGDWT